MSFGSLWQPGLDGQAAFRQKSVLMGVGLYLDAIGEVKSNRMLDVYKYRGGCAPGVGGLHQVHPRAQAEHRRVLEQRHRGDRGVHRRRLHDRPDLGHHRHPAGLEVDPKYKYRAPKEGIITWVDGIAMPSGAENLEQAYEFINFILSPENGGAFSNTTGYNSCVAGAEDHLDEDNKQHLQGGLHRRR